MGRWEGPAWVGPRGPPGGVGSLSGWGRGEWRFWGDVCAGERQDQVDFFWQVSLPEALGEGKKGKGPREAGLAVVILVGSCPQR